MSEHDLNWDELWEHLCQEDEQAYLDLYQKLDSIFTAESKIHGVVNEDLKQELKEEYYQAVQKEIMKCKNLHE